ncbi:MAG: pyruvate ferredoxin oxidoreductase, partial [Deltaproteobacteria bacterium]|nr:pyruvate ferredoxin oxidoreductase [Deltaproteobacteria bacterium]MBW2077777.1 pyruvate ferredoxin oxidoreductase [Deltaproteobacteria bacterium]
PLYEVEHAEVYRQTVVPEEIKPVEEYIRLQGRFRHLTEEDVRGFQKMVDKRFENLQEKFEKGKAGRGQE